MEFKEIEQALADKAREIERTKKREVEEATKRLAVLKTKEEQRQREEKEAQALATRAALQRRIEKQKAEDKTIMDERELRNLEEQDYGKKLAATTLEEERKKSLEKKLLEEVHNEERTQKTVDDAEYSVRKTLGNDGEVIVPNPLERFFQNSPE